MSVDQPKQSVLTKFEIVVTASDDLGPTDWYEWSVFNNGSGSSAIIHQRKDVKAARCAARHAEAKKRVADLRQSFGWSDAPPKATKAKRWWRR